MEERSEYAKNNQNGMSWYLSFKSTEECLEDKTKLKDVKKIEDKRENNKYKY